MRLLVADRSVKTVANLGDDDDPIPSHKRGENRRSARLEGKASQDADVALDGAQSVASENSDPQPIGSDSGAEPSDGDSTIHNEEAEDGSAVFDIPSNDEETDDDKDLDQFTPELMPNLDMLSGFQAYCDTHSHYFLPLTRSDRTSIRLLDSLKRKKAPLNAFEELLEWHLKETKVLEAHETIKDTSEYFHRKTLMKRLLNRYNLQGMVPRIKKLRLPHSKAVVQIPYRNIEDCIVSLLTDPRVEDRHYLFFDQDPLAPPPETVTHLEDLNTGEAFLQSHKQFVTKPNQVALGLKLYIDGAVTGQFSDLPVTALKVALGIHSQEARFEEWAWRTIAWIPQVRKQKARGKKLFHESKHMESQDLELLDGEGDYAETTDEDTDAEDEEDNEPAVKAQDFHSMLSFALKGLINLQETGFIWDVAAYGKLFKGIEFVLFVINVNCDSEEGDLLCGKFTVRTSNVKHICRYCHCPTSDADNPNAKYKMKTPQEIQRLVDRGDLEALREMSQQNIQNAWYPVRFHAANNRGIHGACPSEMLHAILLGIFKYARGIFFQYMGEESKLAEDINGLAQMYGKLLTHQSDRDLPHTNFSKGIQRGKLMAKQYRGVLLVMASVLASTKGRQLLIKRRRFGKEEGLRDWTLLVELLLEWEAFLCEKRMKREDVVRLARKHRFIMYIMKNVANRLKGMGLRIMKFHAILHLVEDILLYGVPSEFDTGANESHHKGTKTAAKLTQRNEVTFDYQTAVRMTEFLVIDYAVLELKGRMVWEYFSRLEDADDKSSMSISDGHSTDMDSEEHGLDHEASGSMEEASQSGEESLLIQTGGTRIEVFEDPDNANEPSFCLMGRSKHRKKTRWQSDIIEFLNELQNSLGETLDGNGLSIYTEHRRGSILFRGHPNHRGTGPWRDWAIFDWGAYGRLPCHIWCFVDLTGVDLSATNLDFGGVKVQNEVYAVAECASHEPSEDNNAPKSDLFTPILVEVERIGEQSGEVEERRYYLAPVSAIVGPCIAVPDIGGPPNAFFQVKPRSQWSSEFVRWLREPHAADVMYESDKEGDSNDEGDD